MSNSAVRMDSSNEEEEERALRLAALNSMHSKANAKQSRRTEEEVHKESSDQRRTHYFSRNASKRSNLIVLTTNDTHFVPKHSDNSHRNDSSQTSHHTSHQRVLPGRFSRLEKENDDSDESDDEFEEENDSDSRAFNSGDSTTHLLSQRDCIIDSDCTNSNSMSNTMTAIVNKHNSDTNCNECDSNRFNVNNYDNSIMPNNDSNDESNALLSKQLSDEKSNDDNKRETIKLNVTNNVTSSDTLERRKQKFGSQNSDERTVKSVKSSQSDANNFNKSSIRNSVKLPNRRSRKSRLSNGNEEHKRERNKRIDSEFDGDIDSEGGNKKKLRSLVVLKAE